MQHKNLSAEDGAPTAKVQASLNDTDTGRVTSGRVNGKGNGHHPARASPQDAADRRDGRDESQDQNGALRAPMGRDDGDDTDSDANAPLDDGTDGFADFVDRSTDWPLDPAQYVDADRAQGFHGGGPVKFTVAENATNRLTKAYAPSADGMAFKRLNGPFTQNSGRFIQASLPVKAPMTALNALLSGLKTPQCIMIGIYGGTAPMRKMRHKPVWEKLGDAERDPAGDGPVYRGPECFGFVPRHPALFGIDHDTKDFDQAPEVKLKLEQAGGLLAVLALIDPQWRTIGVVVRASCSTGIRNTRSGATKAGGQHVYAIARDGGDLTRYVKLVFDHGVMMGFGYALVDDGGRILERGLLDVVASGMPDRMMFEAPAVLEGDHLEHVANLVPEPDVREGPILDTHALPDLTPDQEWRVAEIWAGLKAERAEEARAIRLKRAEAGIAQAMQQQDLTRAQAEQQALAAFERKRLDLNNEYWFMRKLLNGSEWASGRAILVSPEVFDGQTARDPLEPSYENGKQTAVWRLAAAGGGFEVRSLAHSGGPHQYSLSYEASDVIARINAELTGLRAAEMIEGLRRIMRMYWPSDAEQGRLALRTARIPSLAVFDFDDDGGLLAGVPAALERGDWLSLARLRVQMGIVFDAAVDELRVADEDMGLGIARDVPGGWNGVMAKLDALAAAIAEQEPIWRRLDDEARARMEAVVAGGHFPLTEDGLALAFGAAHRDWLRFDHSLDRWFVRDTSVWRKDEMGWVRSWMHTMRRSLRDTTDKPPGAFFKMHTTFVVERAVRDGAPFSVTHDVWDRDPWLLGVPGGVIDLRTGDLLPADPTQMITKQARIAPAPTGTPTPIWDGFLAEAMGGNQDLVAFIHHWFGYCLSGDMSWESIAFLHGVGGNGKGTAVKATTECAGDYAVRSPMETFMERKHPEHLTEIARLAGARMVTASEIADNAAFNLARLKEHSGNESKLPARFMNKDMFEFDPTHKLTLVGNHKPRLAHVDDAIRRRLKLVPFLHKPAALDPTLKDRLVVEYPGILRKLIEGCREVHQALQRGPGGLEALVPAAVTAASSDYFTEEDVIASWLRERCVFDPAGQVGVGEAYVDHQTWAAAEGRAPFARQRKFSAAVMQADARCSLDRNNQGMVFEGIMLVAHPVASG